MMKTFVMVVVGLLIVAKDALCVAVLFLALGQIVISVIIMMSVVVVDWRK
jgi:hypothetical protein